MAEILDPVTVEKLEAVKRFKRFHQWKKSMRYFVLFSVPVIICFSLFDLKAILPSVREVCLVKIPEIWHFCSDERFLFLLSNVIIMSLAANSGLLNPSDGGADLYDEFLRKSKAARKYYVSVNSQSDLTKEKTVAREATVQGSSQAKYGRSKSEIVKRTARQNDRKLRRSDSEQTAQRRRNSEEAASKDGAPEEADVVDEELNRKFEEFIVKFQREMRLQGQRSLIPSS